MLTKIVCLTKNQTTYREILQEEAKEAFKEAEVLIEKDVVRTRCTSANNKTEQCTDLLRLTQVLVCV